MSIRTGCGLWVLAAGAAACTTHVGAEPATFTVVSRVGFFDPCDIDSDCPPPTLCEHVTVDYGTRSVSDSFCTLGCLSDRDCPAGGVCIDAFGGGPLCAEACAFDSDCPSGFGCVSQFRDRSVPPVCLPL